MMGTVRGVGLLVLALWLIGSIPAGAQSEKTDKSSASVQGQEAGYGVWEGEGLQSNGSRWSIRLTLSPEGYKIEYPSLSCGGTLNVLEKTSGYVRAIEKITFGQKNCYDGGLVVLVWVRPETMDFLWYYPDGSRGAVGALLKVR
ncbi:MAG: hypothetical protein AB1896_06955 [Thermodesulfobacteriota bacterium]